MTSDEKIAMLREAVKNLIDFGNDPRDRRSIWAVDEGKKALASTAPEQHPSGDSQDQDSGWLPMESAPRDDVIDIAWRLGNAQDVSPCEWDLEDEVWYDLCDREVMPEGIILIGWKPRRNPPPFPPTRTAEGE